MYYYIRPNYAPIDILKCSIQHYTLYYKPFPKNPIISYPNLTSTHSPYGNANNSRK